MKKLFSIIGLIGLATPLLAAKISDSQLELGKESSTDNKEILFNIGEGTGNPKIRANYGTKKLEFTNDGTNFLEVGSGGESGAYNIIDNAGFESDLTNWTNTGSGSLSVDTDAADVYQGLKSALWDAAAASDILASQAVTIPGGLRGNLCSVEVQYKGGDDNLKLQAYDGTNVLAEVALEASGNFSKAMVTFTCPNSGTLQGRLIASADAAAVNVDNWVVGKSADIIDLVSSTAWKSFIPTTANVTFGTTTVNSWQYRIVGRSLEVKVNFVQSTAGTQTGNFELDLPDGLLIDTDAQPAGSNGGPVNFSEGYLIACLGGTCSSRVEYKPRIKDTNSVDFRFQNTALDTSATANFADADFRLGGYFSVPIDPNSIPLNVNPIQRVETSAWSVDAYSSSFLNLPTTTQATSFLPSSPTAGLVINAGSIAAKVLCDGVISTGMTCSGADELPGIVFDAPRAGNAFICANTNSFVNENSGTTNFQNIFQIFKVPADGSVQDGLLDTNWTRIQTIPALARLQLVLNSASNASQTTPIRMCGIANLNAGANAFAIGTSVTATSGNPGDNQMRAFGFQVFPIEQQLPQALITQTTDASSINTGTLDEDRLPATINNVRTIAASGSTGVTSNGNATNFARITLPTNLGYGLSGGVAHITLASADQLYAATVSFDRQSNSNLIIARIIASSGNNTFMGTISLSQSGNELRFNYNASSGNSGLVRATIIVQTVVPDVSISF